MQKEGKELNIVFQDLICSTMPQTRVRSLSTPLHLSAIEKLMSRKTLPDMSKLMRVSKAKQMDRKTLRELIENLQ